MEKKKRTLSEPSPPEVLGDLEKEDVEDTRIWQTRVIRPDEVPPENADTTIERYTYRGFSFLVKRRKPESDRQPMTHVVAETEGGERTITKYAGTRFGRDGVWAIIVAYVTGHKHGSSQ